MKRNKKKKLLEVSDMKVVSDEISESDDNDNIEENDKPIEISVKNTLNFEESILFVNNIVDICVDSDTGEYNPEMFDFMVKLFTVKFYSNAEISGDVENDYKLIYESDIFDKVFEQINATQFNELVRSASAKIDFKVSSIINTATSRITELLEKFEEMINEGTEKISQINPSEVADMVSLAQTLQSAGEDEIATKIYEKMMSSSEDTKNNEESSV